MSLIVKLQNNGEDISLEVNRDEDFTSVLKKASALVGYNVDLSCFAGEDTVSLTDNVYDYFMNNDQYPTEYEGVDGEEEPEQQPETSETNKTEEPEAETAETEPTESEQVIKIIELDEITQQLGENFSEEEVLEILTNFIKQKSGPGGNTTENDFDEESVDVAKIIDQKTLARVKCNFCNDKVTSTTPLKRNFILSVRNYTAYLNNISVNRHLPANPICNKCLDNNYAKHKISSENLSEDEYLIIRNGVKATYKKKMVIEKRDIKTSKVQDVSFEDVINVIKNRQNTSQSDESAAKKKIKETQSPSIKRKLEMDGTISEVIADDADIRIKQEEKRLKLTKETVACKLCNAELSELKEIVDHSSVHLENSNFTCVVCLKNYKNINLLKKHIVNEHSVGMKDETPELSAKQEDGVDETVQEDDLTDRLHKYLSGELDADTFFQQECVQTEDGSQVLLDADYDDDDVIVCIVESEKPEGEESADSNIQNDVMNASVNSADESELIQSSENVEDSSEIQIYEEGEHSNEMTSADVETFEEIDYFEDSEYDPSKDTDGDDEKSPKKKWISMAKHKCDICHKAYATAARFEQHKCFPFVNTGAVDEKKDETTCSVCKETFLSKVRLHFHRQTHKEGGWQHMACDHCQRKDFSSEHELFDHIYYSHAKPLHCPFQGCTKTFKLKKLLKAHIRDHGTKKYECNICGQRFQVHQTLKEHMVLHLKVKPYQCHICQKFMSKASRLRMHLLVHNSEQRPNYVLVCRYCDAAFKDAAEAEAHCDNLHECEPREEDKDGVFNEIFDDMDVYTIEELKLKWKKNSKYPNMTENDEESVEEAIANKHNLLLQLSDVARNSTSAVWIDKVYSCQYCEKVYYTKEALHQHRLIHNGINHPYQCHLCEAKFLTYSRCTAHKSTHGYFKEGGAPSLRDFPVIKHYLCDICDKSNLLWTTVSVHYRHHHKHNSTRKNPPPCKTCYQQFSSSWELGKHRRVKHRKEVHEGSKAPTKVVNYTYKCVECHEQFLDKTALLNHRKTEHGPPEESGKKSKHGGLLVCSDCGKTYATKPALLTHIKWHTEHGIGAEAAKRRKRAFGKGSHICSTCGLGFYSAANLRAHIDRIHEKTFKYTCEECGKGHFTYMEMETHKLTHTGERPYKCPVCPRAYVTKAILNKHYRNHTGERPYACDVCDMTFKTAHSRNYHRAKHISGKLPSPFIVLKVTGQARALQAALEHVSMQGGSKDKDDKQLMKQISDNEYIKEEMDDFHPDVNEEEVLVRTSEDVEIENIVSIQDEAAEGSQIIYKKIVGPLNESSCENEYTIEYEEEIQ